MTPDQIGGLALWLKADEITGLSHGDPIATWSDFSGNNFHAAQSNNGERPLYKLEGPGGKPAVAFEGGLKYFTLGSNYIFSASEGLTIFALIRSTIEPNSLNYFYSFGNNAPQHYGSIWTKSTASIQTPTGYGGASATSSHSLDTDFGIYTGQIIFGDRQFVRVDGEELVSVPITTSKLTATEIAASSTPQGGSGPVTIGAQSKSFNRVEEARYHQGHICELIVFTEKLTVEQLEGIEGYLYSKWLFPGLHHTVEVNPNNVGYQEDSEVIYKWKEIQVENEGPALTDHQVPLQNLIIDETDLVFSLHLNEESGQFARDHVRYPIHIEMNNTTCYEDPEMGWVRDFNGTNSYGAEDGNGSSHLTFSNRMTMSAWVYPRARQTTSDLDNIVTRRQHLVLSPTGQIGAYLYGTSNPGYHYSNSTIPLNEWSHIAWTWTGSTGTLTFYINGEVDRVVTGITGNTDNNASWFRVGGVPPSESTTTTRFFNGRISHVKIYRRELSPSEIAILGNKNRGFKLDYSDVQLLDSNRAPIPNWKEYDGRWWIKTDLEENSTSKFYIHYGKTIINNYDGEQTFEFFDDFDGDDINLDKWEMAWDLGTGTKTIENGILKAVNTQFNMGHIVDLNKDKLILEVKARNIDSPSEANLRTRAVFDRGNHDVGVFKNSWSPYGQIYVGSWTPVNIPFKRWTTWRTLYNSAERVYAFDDFYQSSVFIASTINNRVRIQVGDSAVGGFKGNSEIDYALVRNYAPNNTTNIIFIGPENNVYQTTGPHVMGHSYRSTLEDHQRISWTFGVTGPVGRYLHFPKNSRHDTLGLRTISWKKGDLDGV